MYTFSAQLFSNGVVLNVLIYGGSNLQFLGLFCDLLD